MKQASLFDNDAASHLAGLVPAIRAAMHRAAGTDDDGRKLLVDKINAVAASAGVRLTAGNAKAISKDTLDKWLSPSDRDHTPSLLAVAAFVQATGNVEPLRVLLRGAGLDVMTDEDKRLRDYGKACVHEKQARKRKRRLEEDING
ncbi:MAG: hypothetical protein AB7E47_06020 [Desulfovibrionaceae bacterium]